MRRKLLGAAIATGLIGGAVYAQMGHAPAPELKKLDYFAGSWKVDADMKASPYGPGGKITGMDKCEWMQGNYFLVIHSTFNSPMGAGVEAAYMGYDSAKKVYTYESFNSEGERESATGTVDSDGKNWSWNSAGDMGGQPGKWRYSETILSPTCYSVKFEMSRDGSNWSTVMEGKATKQ